MSITWSTSISTFRSSTLCEAKYATYRPSGEIVPPDTSTMRFIASSENSAESARCNTPLELDLDRQVEVKRERIVTGERVAVRRHKRLQEIRISLDAVCRDVVRPGAVIEVSADIERVRGIAARGAARRVSRRPWLS